MYACHEAHGAGCGSKIITSLQFIRATTVDFRITEILKNAFRKTSGSSKEMENLVLSTPK